jgi:hypothetical protein
MGRLIQSFVTTGLLCFGLGIADSDAATRWVNLEETLPIPPGNGCQNAGYAPFRAR